MITVSKQQARRFLLHKQMLLPPKSLSGKSAVEKVFQSLRLLQFDPLNPCGRNIDLVLQARISDYHLDDYFTWLYQEKKGMECYDKELCIVPIEDFPLIYHHLHKTQNHYRIGPFLKKYQKELEEVMLQIAKSGPVSSAGIVSEIRTNGGWGDSATFGRIALESLWRIGRLTVVKREKGRKYYGLPDKHYGNSFIVDKRYMSIERVHLIRRLRAVGILPKSGTGGGWQGVGSAKEISILIDDLIRTQVLSEVTVQDLKKPYVILSEDSAILNGKKGEEIVRPQMIFIAPLDNLMWDRQMIEDFFGFTYRWEVYTPLAKRQYGYYVLPILYGDKFVGRIEPVLDKNKTLTIKGIWKETNWDTATQKACDTALLLFQQYLHAQTIVKL